MHRSLHRSGSRSVHASCEALEPRRLLTTVNVSTTAELVNAVNSGAVGDTINVASGTYTLTASLQPKASMIIQGAGAGQTILTADWTPTYGNLPESQTSGADDNKSAYLFNLGGNDGIKILHMTLDGADTLQGAIIGDGADNLELAHLRIEDTVWSGIRTYLMDNSSIHNNDFVNTGGRWQSGVPGTTGGVTGGGIYVTYMKTTQIYENGFSRTNTGAERNFYGIKGYQARNSRIHHNTIDVNFSIEFPHEHDHYVEIDHNYLAGTVSIPKHGGGSLPTGTDPYTFYIHHNYFKKSYALEWARNGAEVAWNLFDASTTDDTGNLITNHADSDVVTANGSTKFHDNLIKNPGRGIYNSTGHVYNNISFYNNHVIGNTTATPRTEGMFGLPTATNFSTINIKDNIFEFNGQSRPLFRNAASYASNVENNTLTNVSDSGNYSNLNTGATRGPTAALNFTIGQGSEYTVDGWNISATATATTLTAAEDSDVNQGSPNATAGNAISLRTRNATNDLRSLLKFNLASLGTINSAKLRLYCTSVSGVPTTVNLYQVTTDTWAEASVTWNNAPANGTLIGGKNITGGAWFEWDVTSYIQSQAAGDDVASFGLLNNNGKTVYFASSENGSNQPQLVINDSALTATTTAVKEGNQAIGQKEANRLLDEAKRRWVVAGFSRSLFSGVRLAVADLDGGTLASTVGCVITLDRTAAGHGWFIDRSPRCDSEFSGAGLAGTDLLTVIARELGHVAGLDHADVGLMSATLATGVRVL